MTGTTMSSRRPLDPWELFLWGIGVLAIPYWLATSSWSSSTAVTWSLLTAAGMAAALLLRSRYPVVAFVVICFVTLVPPLMRVDAVAPWAVSQVVLFSVTMRTRPRVSAWFAGGLAALLLFLAVVVVGGSTTLGISLGVVAWTFGVWGLASSISAQRALVDSLAERARDLLRTRENEIARRLAEQRLQIARDLHDELAHNIAVISVSAGAAETALSKDPSRAEEPLQAIRSTARSVLAELQQIVGLLRSRPAEGPPPLTPESVLEGARNLGLTVTVSGRWPGRTGTVAADRAAARILQEALTNARRYGSRPVADIRFGMNGASRWMQIENPTDARRSSEPEGSGFGLRGMHERAVLVGGTLSVDARDGRFTVRFSVPLGVGTEEGAGES